MNRQWCPPRPCQMELISAPSLPSFGTQPCAIAELRAVNEAAALQQQNVPHEAEPPPPPPPVLDAADLETPWEEGTDRILGRWQYSEEEQEALRKRRAEDARIRSELRRLNEEASYEPVSCVPLSNSALAFLDYLEAAAAKDTAAAACDGPPTPKPLPPSAPPAPTQAQAASEAALSVDGVRRTP